MLQEAFIRVFSYIDQFKFQGSLEGWIRRITVNAALKILQGKKIHFLEIKEEPSTAVINPRAISDLGAEELLDLDRLWRRAK